MTATVEETEAGVSAPVASPRATLVGVMTVSGVQIPMVLDADAPLSLMVDPLLKVVGDRLRELAADPLQAEGRGRWALCLADGTPLRPDLSLTEQDVYDGDRLWLRFISDTERRPDVVEHISTAVAANLAGKYASIDAAAAVQIAAAMFAAAVLVSSGLLAAWRYHHQGWLAAVWAGGIAALIWAVALAALLRARTGADCRVGDTLLLGAIPAVAVAAAVAVPGQMGAPHAALGFGVAGSAGLLAARFTGRRLAAYTAVVTMAAAVLGVAVVRMVAPTSAVTMLGCLFLLCVLGYQWAPSISRWLSGIRLPVFPSATGRWVFESRPDLPTTVVQKADGRLTLDGPESVRDVVIASERARSYLTGLLAGLGGVISCCVVGLCDPHSPRRWLPLLLAGFTAGFLIMRGRSFMDRWQALIVTASGVGIVALVAVRYVVALWTPAALSAGMAVLVVLPALGLLVAAVVPRTTFSPLSRKLVEWIEYLCLMPLFPLALWVMNVYAAIRYR